MKGVIFMTYYYVLVEYLLIFFGGGGGDIKLGKRFDNLNICYNKSVVKKIGRGVLNGKETVRI